MGRKMSWCALLLLLGLFASTGRAVRVIVAPSEITNARLGCRYTLVCEVAEITMPLAWLRFGQTVMNGQDNITLMEMALGNGIRRTELTFDPLELAQLGTYQCLVRENLRTINGRIAAPAGPAVKNISVSRVNEVRDVGCTVDSCRNEQYTVQFLYPNGTVLQTDVSTSAMMTFNWQATITSDLANGNFTCEVLQGGSAVDMAIFQFAGTPQEGPTVLPPILPCPTPDRAWPTSTSVVVCFASFLLAVWLR